MWKGITGAGVTEGILPDLDVLIRATIRHDQTNSRQAETLTHATTASILFDTNGVKHVSPNQFPFLIQSLQQLWPARLASGI